MNAVELIAELADWKLFILVLVVYGMCPQLVLRALVLVYPKGDPRRRELLAELYEVPRISRPFWVMENIETAFFDGLVPRVQHGRSRRILTHAKAILGTRAVPRERISHRRGGTQPGLAVTLAKWQCTKRKFTALRDVLAQHPGLTHVHLQLVDGDRITSLEPDMALRVTPSDTLLAELTSTLGRRCLEPTEE